MNFPNIANTKHPDIATTIYESGFQVIPDPKAF